MVTVTDEQINWLMERHGIPECLRTEFETFIARDLNESNYLDGTFYLYRKPLEVMAQLKGTKLTPKSYEVPGKKEDMYQEQRAHELAGTLDTPPAKQPKPKKQRKAKAEKAETTGDVPTFDEGGDDVESELTIEPASPVYSMPRLRKTSE